MPLHINIEDLLSARMVESDRIEYKEGWNPDAIYRSICAFADDFDNIGGVYILIGVEEDKVTKTAKRPVNGLTTKEIGDIQQAMIGFNNLVKPYYAPRLFVEYPLDQRIPSTNYILSKSKKLPSGFQLCGRRSSMLLTVRVGSLSNRSAR